MSEFLELAKSLNDLKLDYDSRLEEIESQDELIHKKMRFVETENDSQVCFGFICTLNLIRIY